MALPMFLSVYINIIDICHSSNEEALSCTRMIGEQPWKDGYSQCTPTKLAICTTQPPENYNKKGNKRK